jgi:hypothetical protein
LKYLEYDFYFHQFSNNSASLISENRIAFTKHYSKNLSDDLATKNFTINAIAMSYGGKLTDADEGCEDIKNRKIRTVGSPKQKFNNYPIEILNALVLASELKFKISDKIPVIFALIIHRYNPVYYFDKKYCQKFNRQTKFRCFYHFSKSRLLIFISIYCGFCPLFDYFYCHFM